MADRDKEKWMVSVIESMEGSKKAQPRMELFAQIEKQLEIVETKIISMGDWSKAAAVAIILLCANVVAYNQLSEKSSSFVDDVRSEESTRSIISNYHIYD